MKIISTNIGDRKQIDWKGKKITTGIFKYSVDKPIFLDSESVKEDTICDWNYHGGVDQAVYAYSFDHYDYWKERYPQLHFQMGMFGENLTVEGLDETQLHQGDIFRVGEAVLEITKPRVPCMKLGIRFQDMSIVKEFWNTTKSGVYFKVLTRGEVKAGDRLVALETFPENPSIAQLYYARR